MALLPIRTKNAWCLFEALYGTFAHCKQPQNLELLKCLVSIYCVGAEFGLRHPPKIAELIGLTEMICRRGALQRYIVFTFLLGIVDFLSNTVGCVPHRSHHRHGPHPVVP